MDNNNNTNNNNNNNAGVDATNADGGGGGNEVGQEASNSDLKELNFNDITRICGMCLSIPSLALQYCEVVYRLTSVLHSDELLDHIRAMGCIDAIVAAMNVHFTSEDIQCLGCRALEAASKEYPPNGRAVARSGGVEAVLAAMANFPCSPAVQVAGCQLLREVVLDPQAIFKSGTAATVVDAMLRFPHENEVQTEGITTLVKFAKTFTSCKQELGRVGAMKAIVRALELLEDNAEHQLWCLVGIQHFSVGCPENLLIAVKEGLLRILLKAIRRHIRSTDIAMIALHLISTILKDGVPPSLCRSVAEEFTSSINTTLILTVVGLHKLENIAAMGFGAFWAASCVSDVACAQLRASNIVPVLLSMLKEDYPESPLVAYKCFTLVSSICNNHGPSKKAFFQCGGFSTVFKIMNKHMSNENVQSSGLNALLFAISTFPYGMEKFFEEGGIAMTLEAMQAHPHANGVLRNGLGVFIHVCADHPEVVYDDRYISPFVVAMKNNPDFLAVHITGTLGITKLCDYRASGVQEKLAALGAVQVLVNLLTSFPKDKFIAPIVLRALEGLLALPSLHKAYWESVAPVLKSALPPLQHIMNGLAEKSFLCLLHREDARVLELRKSGFLCSASGGTGTEWMPQVMFCCITCDGELSLNNYCRICYERCHKGHKVLFVMASSACSCKNRHCKAVPTEVVWSNHIDKDFLPIETL